MYLIVGPFWIPSSGCLSAPGDSALALWGGNHCPYVNNKSGSMFAQRKPQATANHFMKYVVVTPWSGATCLALVLGFVRLRYPVFLWSGVHCIDIPMKSAKWNWANPVENMLSLFTSGVLDEIRKLRVGIFLCYDKHFRGVLIGILSCWDKPSRTVGQ